MDTSDLKNQDIQINTEQPKEKYNNNQNNNSDQNNELGKIQSKAEEKVGNTMVQSATEQFTKTWIEKYLCCLDFLKQYFEINSSDFYKRFLYSLIPFNHKFQELTDKNPDLYGPFWVYTTLILVIAAAGSLTRFIQGSSNKNFFQEFVPIAAGVIYGVGFGLPVLLTFLMKIFGSELSFVAVICTYGYSFSIYIPIAIACICPISWVQWILLGYATFSSTSLLVVNYWKDLGKYVDKKRYIIIFLVLICQGGLFLLFKLYFFKQFAEEISGDNTNK